MKNLTFIILAALSIVSFKMAAVTGYPFTVNTKGDGSQAILFIPGFASSGNVWEATINALPSNYKSYSFTMAGFAGVPAQANSSVKYWEAQIVQYIHDLNIEKPIIIGHSMGGAMAMAIASDYPDLVKKIIVVDALPCLPVMMNPNFRSVENINCDEMVKNMMSMPNKEFLDQQKNSVARLVADTSRYSTITNWGVNSDRETFAKIYCEISNIDLRSDINKIKCPSLVLLESYFKLMKPNIEEQYKNLKNVNLQYADKGLHFIIYDDQEWYLRQVLNFLQ